MYLKRLKLKNYRLIEDADIAFQRGMNVLIGKNSTGKSAVLEAIQFLLSADNANIPVKEIIPYSKRNEQTAEVIVSGFFGMSNIEKKMLCSFITNTNDQILIRESHLEIAYTKIINKIDENTIRVSQKVEANGNGISQNQELLSHIMGFLLPKMQINNVLKMINFENDMSEQIIMSQNQLERKVYQEPSYIHQYVRNALYDMKVSDKDEFEKTKKDILNAYQEIEDMDVEFDPKRAQLRLYFKAKGSDIRKPLENEGLGIREFVYLLLILRNFPDTIILQDEALTHMHKSLLCDFILAIDGLQYQMITTSHIKDLIKTLDFGNLITCRKHNDKTIVKNLMEEKEMSAVLEEIGYPVDNVPEIDLLLNGNR